VWRLKNIQGPEVNKNVWMGRVGISGP
jgi:hypothetical protein